MATPRLLQDVLLKGVSGVGDYAAENANAAQGRYSRGLFWTSRSPLMIGAAERQQSLYIRMEEIEGQTCDDNAG